MNLRCPELDALRRLHDGSLPSARRTQLLVHLQACAKCAQRLAEWEATDALLCRTAPRATALDQRVAHEVFRQALTASGAVQPATPRFLRYWRWQFAGLAFLAMAAGSLLFQFQPGTDQARLYDSTSSPTSHHPVPAPHRVAWAEPPVQKSSGLQPAMVKGELRRAKRLRKQRARAPTFHRVASRAPSVATPPKTEEPSDRMSGSQPALPDTTPPLLLVSVTRSQPTIDLIVTQSTEETPGYAKAEALEITPDGQQVLTLATVSTCTAAPPENTPESPEPNADDPKEPENETR